jgi:hypothetical protein
MNFASFTKPNSYFDENMQQAPEIGGLGDAGDWWGNYIRSIVGSNNIDPVISVDTDYMYYTNAPNYTEHHQTYQVNFAGTNYADTTPNH